MQIGSNISKRFYKLAPLRQGSYEQQIKSINGGDAMESGTFRKWLVRQGCRIDHGEHQQRHRGLVVVTVHREGRKTEVPLGGSHQIIDPRVVRRACEQLGLDPAELPGPKSRV